MNREITRLEQNRKRKNLTRKQLAILCDLNENTIKKLEYGLLSFEEMKLSTLLKLSKGLRVKPKDLLPIEISRKLR